MAPDTIAYNTYLEINDMNELDPGRAAPRRMNPSVIREILKVTEKARHHQPGWRPAVAQDFPGIGVCRSLGRRAGQRWPRRPAIRRQRRLCAPAPGDCRLPALECGPDQILITTGSQQALDLIAKVLIDESSRVLVETPTYLGALQAFTPMEPTVVAVASDDEGVLIDDLKAKVGTGADKARFLYALPNFQNPDRPHHERRAPRRAGESRRRAEPAAGRRQPLRRPAGSTTRRPRRSRPATPRAASTWARSPRCWPRACAWATSWRPRPCTPSCCRPSRRPTCTRPASTSAWWPR